MSMCFHKFKVRLKIYQCNNSSDRRGVLTKYRCRHLALRLSLMHIEPRRDSRLHYCPRLQNTVNFSNKQNYTEIRATVFNQVLTIFKPNEEVKKQHTLNSIMELFWAIEVQENNFWVDPIELEILHTMVGKLK